VLFAYLLGTFLNDDDFRDIDVAIYIDQKKLAKPGDADYEIDLSLELEKHVNPGEIFKRAVYCQFKPFYGIINNGKIKFQKQMGVGNRCLQRPG
jgi:predicted nucleotidyltransferase